MSSPVALHPSTSGSPLSAEDLRVLADARLRARKIRRAASVATMGGWSMALFAGLTLIAVLFGDLVALVLAVLLGAIAWNELQGGAMLRRFDPRGARRLGFNQLALGALIVAYSAWSLVTSLRSPALARLGGSTGDASSDAAIRSITDMVTYGLYGSMAIFGIIVPGLTAWYYFTRERLVRRIVHDTPAWAIETMRIAA